MATLFRNYYKTNIYDNKWEYYSLHYSTLTLMFSIGKQGMEEMKDKKKYRDIGKILFSKLELKLE